MNIYVGNLPYAAQDEDLRNTFKEFGEVVSAEVIIDRRTRRSRGYGFVEMANDDDGHDAIEALDGSDFQGRSLRVDESKPKSEKTSYNEGGDNRSRGRNQNRNQNQNHGNNQGNSDSSGGGLFGFVKRLFS